jgi:acyl-CoA synthetase (AMP-forming)/AMP-acid ligase II
MAMIDFFDRGLSLGPQNIAYSKDGEDWSYQQAYDANCRVAQALAATGLPQETRCAVLAGNDPLAWLCVLGVWRVGLAWVPLNPRSTPEDHLQLLAGFDVEVLFFQKAFAPVIEAVRAQYPGLKLLVCIDGDVEGALSFEAWCGHYPPEPPKQRADSDLLAAIMPTGGTTGIPKGVMLTQRNLALSIANNIINTQYPAGDPIVNLAAAPMTHTAGFLTLSATARGGRIVIMTKPDPVLLLDTVCNEGVTEFFLPPTVIYRLLDMPGIAERDFSKLRYLMYGAAPMSVEKLREALRVFGPVMFQGYGQTEAPGSISFLRTGDHFRSGEIADDYRLSSCGLPSVLNATAIMDDDCNVLKQGETGEICVRGDIVMKGYYKQPDKTAEAIVDGWLHTGDLGHIDGEGYLHITDRKKDVIISGGFNVYPSEVEQVIWSHPAVMDCAVIGVPDDQWGEAVKAVVELRGGMTVTPEELIALCKDRLGSVKAPKSVDFIAELPRSPVGKVLKKDLRSTYWANADRKI